MKYLKNYNESKSSSEMKLIDILKYVYLFFMIILNILYQW
jgi:hypothetical protein